MEELLKGRVVALTKVWLEIKVSMCTPWRFMGRTFTDSLILTLGKGCRWSRDSMLSIMTWLRAGRSRDRILAGPFIPHLELPQPRIQWLPGALFPKVKRPGREAHHSTSSSAEFKNECSYTTTTSPICFHGLYWDLFFPTRCGWAVRHTTQLLIPRVPTQEKAGWDSKPFWSTMQRGSSRPFAVQANLVITPTLPDFEERLNRMMNVSVHGSVVSTPYTYE